MMITANQERYDLTDRMSYSGFHAAEALKVEVNVKRHSTPYVPQLRANSDNTIRLSGLLPYITISARCTHLAMAMVVLLARLRRLCCDERGLMM